MTALITIKTFNGYAINDGVNYEAKDFGGAFTNTPSAKSTWVQQSKADQIYSGTYVVDTRMLSIGIKIVGSDKNTLAGQLRVWLKRGTYGNLVARFSDDSTDYYLPCSVVSLVSSPSDAYAGDYVVTLQTSTTAWIAVTASTSTWYYVPTSAETTSITVGGTDTTKLIVSIRPTGNPAAGYLYHANYRIYNVVGRNFGYYPHCMTVNTAAMIAAGQMQASCNDLLVYVNGVSVPRWITGANTTTTKVWFNLYMNAGYILTPSSYYSANTPITADNTITRLTIYAKQYYPNMPARGMLVIDSELFTYNYITINYQPGAYCGYTFNITSRAAYGTTAAAHLKTATVSYMQNAVRLMYGNSVAEDPSTIYDPDHYDDYKPLFDLTASDNTKWVYTPTTGFYDEKRPGRWVNATYGIKTANTRSYHYDFYQEDLSSGSAAMGMKLSSYKTGNAWTALTSAYIEWRLNHAAGISKVTVTGYKKKNMTNWLGAFNIAKPPALAGLQKSTDNVNWTNVWTEATSGSAWDAITNTSAATVSSAYARLILAAGTTGLPVPSTAIAATGHGCENHLEIASATVEFQAYLPAVSPSTITTTHTITDHMHLIGSISNTTNSNKVNFDFPMLKNKTFTIDSETAEATYNGAHVYNSVNINDPSRSTWLELSPGSNSLSIDSGSMGNSTVSLSWYKRRI